MRDRNNGTAGNRGRCLGQSFSYGTIFLRGDNRLSPQGGVLLGNYEALLYMVEKVSPHE